MPDFKTRLPWIADLLAFIVVALLPWSSRHSEYGRWRFYCRWFCCGTGMGPRRAALRGGLFGLG